jgi:hypothetical protein
MQGMKLFYICLGKLNVDSSRSFVRIANFKLDVVACAGVNKALHVTDVDEDVVRLVFDCDEAEATVVKPASNRSLQLNLSPHYGLGGKRSAYRTKRRGNTRIKSGSYVMSFVLHGKNAVCFLDTMTLSGSLLKVWYS